MGVCESTSLLHIALLFAGSSGCETAALSFCYVSKNLGGNRQPSLFFSGKTEGSKLHHSFILSSPLVNQLIKYQTATLRFSQDT